MTRRTFEINEEVLLKVEEGKKKEDDIDIVPFRVIGKIHKRNYEIINNEGKKYTRNVEWLRPFYQKIV